VQVADVWRLKILWCYSEKSAPHHLKNVTFLSGVPDFENPENVSTLIVLDDLMDSAYSTNFSQLFTKGSHHRNISLVLSYRHVFIIEATQHVQSAELPVQVLPLLWLVRTARRTNSLQARGNGYKPACSAIYRIRNRYSWIRKFSCFLFQQGTSISSNSKHIVVSRTRDKTQIVNLARQIYPEHISSFHKTYLHVCEDPHSYLFLDFTQYFTKYFKSQKTIR